MSKFKVGDKVAIVKEPYFLISKGKKRRSNPSAKIGMVTTISRIGTAHKKEYILTDCKKALVHEDCLELVEEPKKEFDQRGIIEQLDDYMEGNYTSTPTNYPFHELFAEQVVLNYKPKKSIMKKLTNNLKRMLSKDHQTLYKADFLNGDLEPTSRSTEALIQILHEEYEEKLVKKAEERLKELEEEKKK